MNRRSLLRTSALALPAMALAACAVTTSNGVTTVTLNVAQVDAWGNALVNGANLITSLPGVSGSPAAATVSVVGKLLSADLSAFNTATKGSLSLTFSSNSVPAVVSSLTTDAGTLLSDAKAAAGSVASTALTEAQTYLNAIETIVSLVEALVPGLAVSAQIGAAPKMSEAQALAVLGAH